MPESKSKNDEILVNQRFAHFPAPLYNGCNTQRSETQNDVSIEMLSNRVYPRENIYIPGMHFWWWNTAFHANCHKNDTNRPLER